MARRLSGNQEFIFDLALSLDSCSAGISKGEPLPLLRRVSFLSRRDIHLLFPSRHVRWRKCGDFGPQASLNLTWRYHLGLWLLSLFASLYPPDPEEDHPKDPYRHSDSRAHQCRCRDIAFLAGQILAKGCVSSGGISQETFLHARDGGSGKAAIGD